MRSACVAGVDRSLACDAIHATWPALCRGETSCGHSITAFVGEPAVSANWIAAVSASAVGCLARGVGPGQGGNLASGRPGCVCQGPP